MQSHKNHLLQQIKQVEITVRALECFDPSDHDLLMQLLKKNIEETRRTVESMSTKQNA